jgi:hypothetical protein
MVQVAHELDLAQGALGVHDVFKGV